MNHEHHGFVEYYQDNKDKIFTYLMHRLNFDRALAEDLLMDIVLKAYEHFHQFNPEKGSFKTWLLAIARNHLFNFWRDNHKKKTVSLESLEEEGFSAAFVDAEDLTSQQIESEKVKHILSLMKENEREIISLRYLQMLNYEEMAKVIGKKEGAMRTGLSRAINRFAELYQKFYPEK